MNKSRADFWKSVLAVLSGSATAQAIPFIGSLVIARLFSPTEFGQFATWLGIVSVGAVMMTGRYEMALATENDGEPRRVATQATLMVILISGVFVTLFSIWVGAKAWPDDLHPILLWTGGTAAAFMAASQTLQSWAAADGRYRDLNIIRIVQAAAITFAQIVVGLLDKEFYWLCLAHLGGVMFGIFIASGWLPLFVNEPSSNSKFDRIFGFYRRQRRFPLLALPADSVNTIAAQLPLIVVANRFGADMAGFLALTLRFVGAPIGLLGASVLDVFRRRSAASFTARGECRAEYLDTFRILAIGSVAVAVGAGVLAEYLFVIMFGEIWRMSGTIAMWLMPMFALRFVASPLSYVMYVAQKQHIDLFWQVGLLAMTYATLRWPVTHDAAIQAYGAGYSAMYVIYLYMSYRFSLGARQ